MDEQTKSPSPPTKKAGKTEPSPQPSRVARMQLALTLALLGGFIAWQLSSSRAVDSLTIDYSQFYAFVQSGKVATVAFDGRRIDGELKAPETLSGRATKTFRTTLPPQEDRELLPALRAQSVDIRAVDEKASPWVSLLITLLPWALILGVWAWISRRGQGLTGTAGPLGTFLRGRSKRVEPMENVRVRFDEVAGLAAAKRDLEEVVEFLREPERFKKLGGKLPRGVLLVGPPGTGKTLLARAVAGEAGVPFFYINGSEFIQLFVGVGASRVRELFDEAKKAAPAIVFIDEIDAVGRTRGTGLGGGNDEREQTLNQLLSEMDGFTRSDQVIVLAATNRPDVLDSALLRPGRFDRHVVVDRPECPARVAILKVHTRTIPLAPDVSLEDLAAATAGFSGADLANLANEAALGATRRGADAVAAQDFSAAMDKIVLGDPRETLLAADERKRVASHESGHAIVAFFTENAEPLHRVSILPRGMALGATQQLPRQDRHIATQPELEAKLRVLLGGYASENLLYGNVSSGSENDLREATNLAFKMVAHFGMSPAIGPVFHEQRAEHPFLGQRLATEAGASDATTRAIEEEARRVLVHAAESAKETLVAHRTELDRLIAALVEHETLEMEAFAQVIAVDGSKADGDERAGAASTRAHRAGEGAEGHVSNGKPLQPGAST